jgi:hypothetical protein
MRLLSEGHTLVLLAHDVLKIAPGMLLFLLVLAVSVTAWAANLSGPHTPRGYRGGEHPCVHRVAIGIDVSGSMAQALMTKAPLATANSTAKTLRAELARVIAQDLFGLDVSETNHAAGICVALYSFATKTELLVDYVNYAQPVVDALDQLRLEVTHPDYYTNWEDAITTMCLNHEDGRPVPDTAYLITDGLPSTRMSCDSASQPCDDYATNTVAAVYAAKMAHLAGVRLVPVAVGTEVSDSVLGSLCGSCEIGKCVAGVDFFRVGPIAGLDRVFALPPKGALGQGEGGDHGDPHPDEHHDEHWTGEPHKGRSTTTTTLLTTTETPTTEATTTTAPADPAPVPASPDDITITVGETTAETLADTTTATLDDTTTSLGETTAPTAVDTTTVSLGETTADTSGDTTAESTAETVGETTSAAVVDTTTAVLFETTPETTGETTAIAVGISATLTETPTTTGESTAEATIATIDTTAETIGETTAETLAETTASTLAEPIPATTTTTTATTTVPETTSTTTVTTTTTTASPTTTTSTTTASETTQAPAPAPPPPAPAHASVPQGAVGGGHLRPGHDKVHPGQRRSDGDGGRRERGRHHHARRQSPASVNGADLSVEGETRVVHDDNWVAILIVGLFFGICVVIVVIVICYVSHRKPDRPVPGTVDPFASVPEVSTMAPPPPPPSDVPETANSKLAASLVAHLVASSTGMITSLPGGGKFTPTGQPTGDRTKRE